MTEAINTRYTDVVSLGLPRILQGTTFTGDSRIFQKGTEMGLGH